MAIEMKKQKILKNPDSCVLERFLNEGWTMAFEQFVTDSRNRVVYCCRLERQCPPDDSVDAGRSEVVVDLPPAPILSRQGAGLLGVMVDSNMSQDLKDFIAEKEAYYAERLKVNREKRKRDPYLAAVSKMKRQAQFEEYWGGEHGPSAKNN